jgi:hypothetical protein
MGAVRRALVVVALLACSLTVAAAEPTWDFRFAESKPMKGTNARITITAVKSGGLAYRVGLRSGDTFVSVKVGNREIPVRSREDLDRALKASTAAPTSPNRVTIKVDRAPLTKSGRPEKVRRVTLESELRVAKDASVYVHSAKTLPR